jgi:uncharacterized membrane protein YeaQ/YmgE (transglycosylase-associated protein family)
LQEIATEVFTYLRTNPVLYLGTALVAGFAACKTVAFGWRSSILFFSLMGLIGLLLSQLVLTSFGKEYLEKLPQFRVLFDLLAAYIGSFVIAAIIHFVKPI